jgi:hypothetical protein
LFCLARLHILARLVEQVGLLSASIGLSLGVYSGLFSQAECVDFFPHPLGKALPRSGWCRLRFCRRERRLGGSTCNLRRRLQRDGGRKDQAEQGEQGEQEKKDSAARSGYATMHDGLFRFYEIWIMGQKIIARPPPGGSRLAIGILYSTRRADSSNDCHRVI